jgi:hypothetical protein
MTETNVTPIRPAGPKDPTNALRQRRARDRRRTENPNEIKPDVTVSQLPAVTPVAIPAIAAARVPWSV